MLNTLCPLSIESKANGIALIVNATASLDQELQRLRGQENWQKITFFKRCEDCHGMAIPILAGLVFSDLQLILLDSPITYCLEKNLLFLSPEDLSSFRQRLEQLDLNELLPFPAQGNTEHSVTSSIGQLEFLLGPDLYNALQITEEASLFYAPNSNAIFWGDAATHLASLSSVANALPDRAAFHSNERPTTLSLKFEPTTRCNFKCEFCYGRHLVQGDLNFEDFVNVLDRLPFVKTLELTGEGEPLLNPFLIPMLTLANQRGLWTHITTNASLLTPARCHQLLETGLDSLGISMESFVPEQFERLRPGSKYDRVIEGIRTIAQLRHDREKPLRLELWVSLLQETLDGVEEIAQFADEVGIDSLQFQTLNSMEAYMRFYTPELKQNLLSPEDVQRIIDDPATLPLLKSSLQNVIAWYQGQRCEVFMQSAMVNWEGFVTPCCFLKTPAFQAFGNISLEEFEIIWQRSDYQFFRFALQHGVVLKSCQDCPSVAATVAKFPKIQQLESPGDRSEVLPEEQAKYFV